MDSSSHRAKTYFTALYLRLYKTPGAVLLPFVVIATITDGFFQQWSVAMIIIVGVYLFPAIQAFSDDEETVSHISRKLATSRTPRARRNEGIFYAIALVVLSFGFISQRGIFHETNIWIYLLGVAMYVVIYFLRPGNIKQK